MTVDEPRGYAKGRATRQAILDEAMALFGEVGYRSASLRGIAARSGITHPGLLHHFPTKQALLLAVLAHRDQVDAARFALDHEVGVAVLDSLVELTALNVTRPGIVELYCVLSAEATAREHPAHEYFAARYARTVSCLTDAFTHAVTVGDAPADLDPASAARRLVALMDGLQVQWLLDRDGVDMVADLRTHLSGQLTRPTT